MNLLFAVILTLPIAVTGHAVPVGAGDLFARCQDVPPDATFYLHVEDARVLRREIHDRPLGEWAGQIVEDSEFGTAWSNLSEAARRPAWRLFDWFLGDRFTFVMRERGDVTEWVLLTEAEAQWTEWLSRQLKAKVHLARENMVIEEIIEQNLLMARRGDLLVVGSKAEPGLFNEMIHRLNNVGGNSLAGHESVAAARELGSGVLGMVIRHKAPMGGWSSLVADLQDDDLRIRHRGRFDAAPFRRGTTELTVTTGVLDAFNRHSLVAMVEPTDLGAGTFETYMETLAGVSLFSPAARAALGEHTIISVGENEGRLNDDPIDLLQPTFAAAIALREGTASEDEIDAMVLNWAQATDQALDGAFLSGTGGREFRPRVPRHVDLEPSESWFAGLYPIAREVSLNWVVADTPHGPFLVISTQSAHLDDTVASLQAWGGDGGGSQEHLYNAGTANGVRIGHHLRSYAEQANLFSPEAPAEFRKTLNLLADLAAGIDAANWNLRRPSDNEMELEVRAKLMPGESSGQRSPWP